MSFAASCSACWRLARFDRPIGWLLLLWPTMWALWAAAAGLPEPRLLLVFFIGVVCSRALSCCVNDIADRDLDKLVRRTRDRPLASGELSVAAAVGVAGVFLLACFGAWLALGWPARLWCLVALAVALTYPLAKRWMRIPQLHLALANSMGVPVAYAEIEGAVPATAWLLFAACFCWSFAFDTIYSMADRPDDRAAGINSAAVWLGERELPAITLAYYLTLVLLVGFGAAVGAQLSYYLVTVAGGAAVAWRLLRLIRGRELELCLLSFRQNHWLGAVVLAGIVSNYAAW